ncbi:unnamed protein product [Moneuplotes crassus]|uniref:Uncharacterized protein n=1 Tax=Euplotes crassus TaxID=5936 RepID=A0AAD1UAR1_EUPCR|nr:unnamed protein product [Moneuplotes crassus]
MKRSQSQPEISKYRYLEVGRTMIGILNKNCPNDQTEVSGQYDYKKTFNNFMTNYKKTMKDIKTTLCDQNKSKIRAKRRLSNATVSVENPEGFDSLNESTEFEKRWNRSKHHLIKLSMIDKKSKSREKLIQIALKQKDVQMLLNMKSKVEDEEIESDRILEEDFDIDRYLKKVVKKFKNKARKNRNKQQQSIPKLRKSSSMPANVENREHVNNEENDKLFFFLKQKHSLQDLCNSFYIKFRDIRKKFKGHDISQNQGLMQLFEFIFTLPEVKQDNIQDINQDQKNGAEDIAIMKENVLKDRYLRVKCFLEILNDPQITQNQPKSGLFLNKISPWFPIFPQDIVKLIEGSRKHTKEEKKELVKLCRLYNNNKIDKISIIPESDTKKKTRIYLAHLIKELGKRHLYTKTKPSLRELKVICENIAKKSLERTLEKKKVKVMKKKLNKGRLNRRRNLIVRAPSQQMVDLATPISGGNIQQNKSRSRRTAIQGNLGLSAEFLEQSKAQHRLMMRNKDPDISSSSSGSDTPKPKVMKHAHPNLTTSKLKEAYRDGHVQEVNRIMMTDWNKNIHSCLDLHPSAL